MRKIDAGDWQVVALTDCAPAPALCGYSFPEARLAEHPAAARWFPEGRFLTRFGPFLLRGKAGDVLVDCGMGPTCGYFPGLAGRLPAALAAVGSSLEAIKTVLFTHLHVDHVGWAPFLPNARFFVGADEWAYWPAFRAHHVAAVAECVVPLRERLRVGEALPAGLAWLPAPGHTPGHQAVLVGGRVLIAGDTWHNPAQIEVPAWCHRADGDPALAVATRTRIAERARREAWIIGAGHFEQAFGRIGSDGRFTPL